jgi:hypothetical protein
LVSVLALSSVRARPDAVSESLGEHLRRKEMRDMTKQRLMRASRVPVLAVALFGLFIAAAAGLPPGRATARLAAPRTLYIEHGAIHKFAQDGDRISWVGGAALRRPPPQRDRPADPVRP